MTEEGFKRKLTAILSADVVGYSRLMDDNEEATIRTLTAYRGLMTTLIQQHKGRVVDTTGDNLLAEFASVVDAVNCSVVIQRQLAEKNAEIPEHRRMKFRIGINVGDVVEKEGRIYGDGVNMAARVEGLAEAGGICVSGRVYDQVENKLELEYEFQGEQKVKNIKRPVRVYRVLSVPSVAARVSDLSQLEQGYRERLKARYAEEAAYYVPLAGETTEPIPIQPTKASRSARRRRSRAQLEYQEWIHTAHSIKRIKLKTLREA
ncbi:MAG: adenylate/guanylate cyclase domain-containing protein, partial [Candidatus Hodarchaeales archaeon]